MREHRAVRDERVELAVLATRIDRGRQLVEQRPVGRTSGERRSSAALPGNLPAGRIGRFNHPMLY